MNLHERYIKAENARLKANAELAGAAKQLADAWNNYDAARRLSKKLKERLRKKLQKADK